MSLSSSKYCRPLLPKSPNQTRPEPFMVKAHPRWSILAQSQQDVGKFEDEPKKWLKPQGTSGKQYSVGQRRRRDRESKGNHQPKQSILPVGERSKAQRARRQRELAIKIRTQLALLHTPNKGNARSQSQTLRRSVENGERRLKEDPECDPTYALEDALELEYALNRGEKNTGLYWDQMERLKREVKQLEEA
ncbi:hypothetical protein GGX14DRAFT_385890 [Mycena pura]|uniref:Uncharacterized protein n=1 Tax=Mycena pura TaxID=153505 RepID=A0AAD7E3U7_9AGAR|nr:hypothetical protein GGX14DRAFT_385890 [Mycena pura]